MKDFIAAIAEVRAIKGSAAVDTPSRLLRRGIVATAAHGAVLSRLRRSVRDLARLPAKSFFRVLLHGAPESGLTSVAASVCQMHNFDSVQIVRAESLQHLAADKAADAIQKAVAAAREANDACLVIDGADQLAAAGEFVKAGVASSHSTAVLKALRQALMPAGEFVLGDEEFASAAAKTGGASSGGAGAGRVMLVITVQALSFIRSLGGTNALFDTEEHVPLLGTDDVARVLVGYGLFGRDEMRLAKVAASNYMASDVPVKRVLRAIDVVRSKLAPLAALPCRSGSVGAASDAGTKQDPSSPSSTSSASSPETTEPTRQEQRDGTTRLPRCAEIKAAKANAVRDALRDAAAAYHIDA